MLREYSFRIAAVPLFYFRNMVTQTLNGKKEYCILAIQLSTAKMLTMLISLCQQYFLEVLLQTRTSLFLILSFWLTGKVKI